MSVLRQSVGMSTFEVFCLLSDFVGFFLRLASGIYPRVEDNCCVFFSSWSVVSIGLVEGRSLLASGVRIQFKLSLTQG